MHIYNDLSEYDNSKPAVAALGFFDGVHIGHKALLNVAHSEAQKLGVGSHAVTFDIHPANFLTKKCVSPFITNNEEKARLIAKTNIDNIFFLPFDEKTANMCPEEFVRVILKEKLNLKIAVCGFHYSFGKGGKGNVKDLKHLCKKVGIRVIELPAVLIGNVVISSSYVRNLIQMGDMETAERFLGHCFAINLKVVEGKKIGRKIGIPTINQNFERGSIVPSYGVYATAAIIEGECIPSVTNIGVRPTIEEGSLENMETHLIDKNIDLYGKKVRIEFIKKMRDETRFDNIDVLKKQIEIDILKAVQIVNQKNQKNI
jgi:riboflavin kinase/FMN adenylyltransferase